MRNVVALSVSMVVALAAAYVTWTRDDDEVDDEAVAIFDARESDIQKIAYHTDKVDVVLERRKDDVGDYIWVDSTQRKTRPKKHHKDPHGDEKGDKAKGDKAKGDKAKGDKAKGDKADTEPEEVAAEPEPEEPDVIDVEQSSFLGSELATELTKAMAPLLAMRELEASSDPSVFGFDEPSGSLTITRSSGDTVLEIGGETYGLKDRYVRYGDKVFLVDDAKFKPMQAVSGLMELGLFPSEQRQIDSIEVATATSKVAWMQVNKDDAAKAAWARTGTPDTRDEVGATWIGKVLGLKAQSYVAEGSPDAPGTLEPVFTFDVAAGKELWHTEVFRTTSEPWSYYAKTQFNRSMVKLQEAAAANVVGDLDTVTAAPAAP